MLLVVIHFTLGQRAAAMVRLCHDHLQLPVHLILIPPYEVSEFPIKDYYRYVANPSITSMDTSGLVIKASANTIASFRQMPRAQIFTVRMDVPEAWNVQAIISPQDIDNLVCDSKSCGDKIGSDNSFVTYLLKNLLVTGQCYEFSDEGISPPNGLQLTLDAIRKDNKYLLPSQSKETSTLIGTGSNIHSDTLVMQNLGYFQLQADAGLYLLRLAEGKARTLFTMDSEVSLRNIGGNTLDMQAGDNEGKQGSLFGIPVAVKSFSEEIMKIKVHKRAGMEHIPLLDDPEGSKPSRSIRHKKKSDQDDTVDEATGVVDSMWNSLSSMFGGDTKAATLSSNDTIHVFSLATGHAYERLLRIMMLSVSKRTSSPLKFWLFENYLSPTFKQLASEMALKYGFEVGYVTYKWPKWLTEQTNKQRIIWGYKILFLDVLFPLNVKKVIYVDADQVVRADLKVSISYMKYDFFYFDVMFL